MHLFTHLLLALACAASAFAAELILPGDYHHDDVSAKAAGDWLAVRTGADTQVERARVTVQAVHDPMVDQDGQATGWRVTSSVPARFLVRGALAPGRGETALSFDRPRALAPGEAISMELKGKRWTLTAEPLKAPQKKESTPPVRLVFTEGKARRELIDLPQGMNPEQAKGLLWVGDIDGDGAPDVLMDVSTHYAMSDLALLLSSQAKRKRYVITARFGAGGC